MIVKSITDDSGFIGLANLSEYDSFIGDNWDFQILKKRILDQMNSNNLLFWSTGREDNWKVLISEDNRLKNDNFYRIEEALIQVTDNKLYLVNYETLSMAAQFKKISLPEDHMSNLYVEVRNGLYLVEIGQLVDPNLMDERGEIDFEVRLEFVEEPEDYYPNDFRNIFWYSY